MAIRVTRLDVFKCSVNSNYVLVFRDGSVALSDNIDGVLYPEDKIIKDIPDTIADIISNFYDRFDFRYEREANAFIMYRWVESSPEQVGIITRTKLGYNLFLMETDIAEKIAVEFLSFTEKELGEKSFISFSQFVKEIKKENDESENEEQAINLEFSKDQDK